MTGFFGEGLSIVLKTAVAAAVLFALARVMGKKQISQLSYFDYVVGISIGSVAAALSVDRRISIADGITAMVIWSLFSIAFSYVSVHSITARRLLDSVPIVLIQNGKIIEKNLIKSKFTVNDLLEELRQKDVFNIAEVNFAILETNGKLSVLKSASCQGVTLADMKLVSSKKGICANIIIDGKVMKDNLSQLHLDENWLNGELQKNNIASVQNILLASCDGDGSLHIDKKNADPDDLTVFQ